MALADFVLQQLAEELGRALRFEHAVYDALCNYAWPGNIRELRSTVKCAASMVDNGIVTIGDLPGSVQSQRSTSVDSRIQTIDKARAEYERAYGSRLLAETGGNQSEGREACRSEPSRVPRAVQARRCQHENTVTW